MGDFTGTRIRLNEDGHWDHWEFTPGTCFVSPAQVLAVARAASSATVAATGAGAIVLRGLFTFSALRIRHHRAKSRPPAR
ncbi:hypothetical protein ACIRL2_45025 [Embleya sp. NPDC127516]|uniref:hypothetical protein n=1 Tax=Embleya sp. NPDC127516 TaxID=3363990 RepID=UPI00381CDB91